METKIPFLEKRGSSGRSQINTSFRRKDFRKKIPFLKIQEAVGGAKLVPPIEGGVYKKENPFPSKKRSSGRSQISSSHRRSLQKGKSLPLKMEKAVS